MKDASFIGAEGTTFVALTVGEILSGYFFR